ncbi:hypothetical protein FGO68_gene11601 [Halteria grandinella]|uniref:Uncharacterized protein n=1 Tax=Halteria grandinella TaxID=5974 RepID=A0A8J8NIZ3_HALGN|nr:hypothetical protein FGO68_gene11601 [Halteria grandinella]
MLISEASKHTGPQRIQEQVTKELPCMKWAQSGSMVYLGISIQNMQFFKVQISSDGVLNFTGLSKSDITGKTTVFELNEQLFENIDHSKSGQKEVAGYLQLYLKKIEPELPPYPPPDYPKDMPPPPRQLPEQKYWDFVFKNKNLKKNPRIKVDWPKWRDKDEIEDEMQNFDPEKLVELMKKNGEWDDEDERTLGRQNGQQGEEYGDEVDEQQEPMIPPEGFHEEVEDEGQQKKPIYNPEEESFPFQNYLQKGEYMDIGKRKRQWQDPDELDLDLFEGISFKGEGGKKQKLN